MGMTSLNIPPLSSSKPPVIGKLQKNLLLGHIIIIGLAYIQPLTLLDTFGMVSRDSLQHVPTSYIVALIAVLLTSLSYGQMIRKYPSAGSAYTYVQKSIHPNAGFLVGWSSLLDYLLSPMVNILLANIYLTSLYPHVNHWIWVIGLTALMTYVNLRGAKFVAQLNGFIVFVQLAIIATFIFLVYDKLAHGMNALGAISSQPNGQGLWSMTPFWNETTQLGALITGATILCFSFTGFDALSSLAEETKDTKRTLPRAIFLTALISGIIFIISTYFLQLYFPGNPAQYFADVEATQPDIVKALVSSGLQVAFLYIAVCTVMASGISAHAGVSRLMYVMGRDGVFHKPFFGHLGSKFHTPTYTILLVGVIALSAGFTSLEHVINLISFGALTAFSFVHLSVLFQYAIRDKQFHTLGDLFNNVIVPVLGFIAIAALWKEINPEALKWGLIWAVAGIVYLLYKTRLFSQPVPVHHENAFDDKIDML